MAAGANTGTDIDPKGTYLEKRLAEVLGRETAGKKDRLRGALHEPTTDAPVMHAPCPSQLRYGG
jgi:hypothetical protein